MKDCYFCGFENDFESDGRKETCSKCGKIDGELYAPMTFDNCRICNIRIIIATGDQPDYLKNGWCSARCAGEETYAICR